MEAYPKSLCFKILIASLSLLLIAGCVTDTVVSIPENRSQDGAFVSESDEKIYKIRPDQETAGLPSSTLGIEKPTQAFSGSITEDRTSVVHSDSIDDTVTTSSSPQVEDAAEEVPNRNDEPRTKAFTALREDHRQKISPLKKPSLVAKEKQSNSPLVIIEEKTSPYHLGLKGQEGLPKNPTIKQDTVVSSSTDVADKTFIQSNSTLKKQTNISHNSGLEKNSGLQESLSAVELKKDPGCISSEQKDSISQVDRPEEKILSIPPEIDDVGESILLDQSNNDKPINIPILLEHGKPALSSEEEEVQQVASIPKATNERTLSLSGEGGKRQAMPAATERDDSLKKETQKQLAQGMLDSALEFCQASNDFWEQGDLYSAIDALDQAYSLVLKVNYDDDSELLQQKDDLRFTISKRIIEVYSSRFTVANGRNSVIPLTMNSHVERALNLFKGREKKFFLDSYRRSGKYRPAILRALNEAGLPEELSWLPLIESGFKVNAFSRSRALGLWQFIASTGYKFGLKRDRWVDERMDPGKSTQAAISYLKELHQIFGDWTTSLAAYNCGEGRVLKSIRGQRINYLDNFWDLYERLPLETAFYVPKFLAVLHILKDPEAHGFTLPPVDDEVEAETVPINKQAHLKTISAHTGIPYILLKELNPSLRYNYTPDRPFSIRVPRGKGEVLLSKLDDIPVWHPPVPAYVVHKVRSGETLSVIAGKYKTSVRSIMNLNGLRSSHFIRNGWRLKIPTSRKYERSRGENWEASASKGKTGLAQYLVQKGDSLWRIAERFGTTTKVIQSANQLKDTHLNIGQIILIPKDMEVTVDMETKTYIVSKGDSPYLIAKRNQMKLSQFLKINNLSPRSTIFPGQVLLVRVD
jgi:membrane-bound lytic murein transglycosylase D